MALKAWALSATFAQTGNIVGRTFSRLIACCAASAPALQDRTSTVTSWPRAIFARAQTPERSKALPHTWFRERRQLNINQHWRTTASQNSLSKYRFDVRCARFSLLIVSDSSQQNSLQFTSRMAHRMNPRLLIARRPKTSSSRKLVQQHSQPNTRSLPRSCTTTSALCSTPPPVVRRPHRRALGQHTTRGGRRRFSLRRVVAHPGLLAVA